MKKILIVEDEPAYLSWLHDQLAKNGYEVIDAQNGAQGLKLASDKKPDLILLDLLMPGMGGIKMLDALRRFKWGEAIPVFVLTNVHESNEISESLNSRVSRYIVKSDFELETLLENIKIYLGARVG